MLTLDLCYHYILLPNVCCMLYIPASEKENLSLKAENDAKNTTALVAGVCLDMEKTEASTVTIQQTSN